MTLQALWSADATLIEHWNVEADIKAVMLSHPVHKRKAEGDGYDFYANEVRMAKAMGQAVTGATNKALKVYDEITGLVGVKPHYERKAVFDLGKALQKLEPILRGSWTMGTDKAVTKLIGALTSEGAIRGGDVAAFRRLPTRMNIMEGMVASAKYYTNEYFSRIVLPSMVNDINAKIASGEPFDDTFYRSLRSTMEKRLKNVPYWRLVANQASSRAYHYGMTRAGLSAGYKGYRFVAVLDEKTTDVCRHMNGKTFWLADAVNHLEKIARVPPDEIATAAPWAKFSDVDGKDANQLVASGLLIPPLHGNCRSTISLTK